MKDQGFRAKRLPWRRRGRGDNARRPLASPLPPPPVPTGAPPEAGQRPCVTVNHLWGVIHTPSPNLPPDQGPFGACTRPRPAFTRRRLFVDGAGRRAGGGGLRRRGL